MGSTKGSPWANLLGVLFARMARPLAGPGRHALFLIISVAALFVGLYFAWKKWGPEFTSHERYRLSVDNLEIPPQPPWIHSNVKAEVIRDGNLDELRILDEQVTVKVAGAFALHNWVAKVKRVSKNADPKVVVDLEYRKPVAMVEVNTGGARGLLPIDAASVLLPTDDFSRTATRAYPRIWARDASPAGLTGTPWGDERIAGAARLAALLEESWGMLGLYRIAVSGERDKSRRSAAQYELQSRKGSRILWGRAPGQESLGEDVAAEKLARLREYLQASGPFDGPSGPVTIDLRDLRPTAVQPE